MLYQILIRALKNKGRFYKRGVIMAVFLDGAYVNDESGTENVTVEMSFSTLFNFCQEKGRAIDRFILDGEEFTSDKIVKFFKKELDDIEKLEFFTIDRTELFKHLRDLGLAFSFLADELENISTLMNAGRERDAFAVINRVATFMYDLFHSHSLFIVFGIPLEKPVGKCHISEYRSKINQLLRTVIDAFVAKDVVEFSDVAEYELAPLVRELGQGLKDIEE